MNLGPSKSDPASRRPFQAGRALGPQGSAGQIVAEEVEWLIDTGADIAALWDSIGSQFDGANPIAATASPTTGSAAIQVVEGIETEFEKEDGAGQAAKVRAGGRIAVKSDDRGHNILGAEQLANAGALVAWDPSARLGRLHS